MTHIHIFTHPQKHVHMIVYIYLKSNLHNLYASVRESNILVECIHLISSVNAINVVCM